MKTKEELDKILREIYNLFDEKGITKTNDLITISINIAALTISAFMEQETGNLRKRDALKAGLLGAVSKAIDHFQKNSLKLANLKPEEKNV